MEESTYEQQRREKLQKLRELGIDPYGGRTSGITPLAPIKASYNPEMGHDGGPVVKGAGRIVLKRDMGKLSFLTIRDETGDLQVAFDKKRLDETHWKANDLLDLGDQIVVEGALGVTKKGEVTIWATSFSVAAKALLPPPAKWEGLSDVELRYRQRYVDLWANPGVMDVLKKRIAVVDAVRAFLKSKGFLEVETPMMQALAGGAAARPFVTHHNALDIPLYMRIAPELYLKRLLVGGFTKVFELNRNFRNEGISPRHNPEFTMLEAYEAFGSWETMADLVEEMICHIAQTVFGTLTIEHKGADGTVRKTINLTRPWRRVRMVDLFEQEAGQPFNSATSTAVSHPILTRRLVEKVVGKPIRGVLFEGELAPTDEDGTAIRQIIVEKAKGGYLDRLTKMGPAEYLVEVYEKLIEPTLIDPTYVTHVPSVIIPLARKNRDDDFFADVYELAINGQEISPGYSELNDPEVQAANFQHQVGEDQQKTDDDFLTALRYGMPPAGGMGLGIDRLVMMLTGAESIRDVILFPLMKPIDKSQPEKEISTPT